MAVQRFAIPIDCALRREYPGTNSISPSIRARRRLLCAALQAAPDTIFQGDCREGDPNLSEVEACVIAAARCEACLKINAFGDLNLDCDRADDQTTNGRWP
jgi:hypothetical protein